MGRKPISKDVKTDRPLRIRLTDEERAIIDAAAKVAGRATSSWSRDILLQVANKQSKRKSK